MKSTTQLAKFAADVLKIARGEDVAMFGDRKVFLCTVAEIMHLEGLHTGSMQSFDEICVAAHKAQLLTLARADLVSAMDPDLVKFGQIQADGAQFHFVVSK